MQNLLTLPALAIQATFPAIFYHLSDVPADCKPSFNLPFINIDELGLRNRLRDEAERVNKFQSIIGGKEQKVEVMDVDMKNYAKYILKEGSMFEKRELLSHLKDKLVIREKVVVLG